MYLFSAIYRGYILTLFITFVGAHLVVFLYVYLFCLVNLAVILSWEPKVPPPKLTPPINSRPY